jgi:hypothetical protein
MRVSYSAKSLGRVKRMKSKILYAGLTVAVALIFIIAWPYSFAPIIVFGMIYLGLFDAAFPWLINYGLGVALLVAALPIVLGVAGYLYLLKRLDKWNPKK